ncbi:MAG: hypothetical protein F6K36_19760 [Symploca sp. SIO3C6]|uniref:Uncharacterized protein n=1 Tax=Symploca sp. SIO1C4 TaxID=2607765 RepID=A0A6B3NFL8_9CYAN|nr:hypothetical protein [Symploca sp. SIO3C6]NER30467.1 hypothetical protein [Symploca sp. SIO1C4]NET04098.1 hypothetical protein [Symploca sp. SIO2B6]NET49625.1 hypothetical protein [Merismopedia sp. SIO2A8]
MSENTAQEYVETMAKPMSDDYEVLTASQVLQACHSRLEEITNFLISYEQESVVSKQIVRRHRDK